MGLGSFGSVSIIRKHLENQRCNSRSSASPGMQLSGMKNPPCHDPFVEFITSFPLDLIYGLVENSRRCFRVSRTRFLLGENAGQVPNELRTEQLPRVRHQVKFPWAARSSLGDSSGLLHTEARQLGQLTASNVLLD